MGEHNSSRLTIEQNSKKAIIFIVLIFIALTVLFFVLENLEIISVSDQYVQSFYVAFLVIILGFCAVWFSSNDHNKNDWFMFGAAMLILGLTLFASLSYNETIFTMVTNQTAKIDELSTMINELYDKIDKQSNTNIYNNDTDQIRHANSNSSDAVTNDGNLTIVPP